MMTSVTLRDVTPADLPVFFRHQLDREAIEMVGWVSRSEEEFRAHWAKTANDPACRRLTVLVEGAPAGYVGSFERLGKREVCYWLGREHWGKGAATAALQEFMKGEGQRPLYARVVEWNRGSVRVLEKCGFVLDGADSYAGKAGEKIKELIYKLGAGQG